MAAAGSEGREPTGILPLQPARGTVLRCLYGVLCYSVYVPIFPRTPLNRAHRHARCGKIVENKLVCPRRPLVPSRGRLPPPSVLLSLSPLNSELYFSRRISKLEQTIIFLKNDFFFKS